MGQYHIPINKTKGEYFHAHRINNGLKNLEQVGFMLSSSTALWALLSNSNGRGGGDFPEHQIIGRWAGDEIVVQGDYAVPDDPGYEAHDEKHLTDISEIVLDFLVKLEGY